MRRIAGHGTSYALSVTNAVSGLTVTDGSAINLQLVGGVVVGVVSGGTFNGQAAFAIAIDGGTGVVTVEQYLSLHQDSAHQHAGRRGVDAGAATLGGHGDGDRRRRRPGDGHVIDVSAQISFDDDGPRVTAVTSGVTAALDEGNTDTGAPPTSTPATINTGAIVKGDDPDVAGTGYISQAVSAGALVTPTIAFGADGPRRIGGHGNELCAVGDECGVGADGDRRFGDQPAAGDGGVVVGVVVWRHLQRPGGVCDLDQQRHGRGDGRAVSVAAPGQRSPTRRTTRCRCWRGSLGDHGDGDRRRRRQGERTVTDVSAQISFDDDGPSIVLSGTPVTLTVDETILATNATASFAGAFTSAFGADGAGTITMRWGSMLARRVWWTRRPGKTSFCRWMAGHVEGRTATSNDLVFRVDVDGSGNVTLDQQRAVVHPTNAPNEPKTLSAANLVTLTATITDKDGDSATATLEHRPEPVFLDDGPSISAAGREPTLTVDETVLATNATASFAGAFTSSFGADGAGTITYALGFNAGATGLVDTATGQNVVLSLVAGHVEGRTATSNDLVFRVDVDGSGNVTLDQQRAVVHPTNDPNEPKTLSADNLVTLTATITDKDGDSATATLNIGQNLAFLDDGPVANPVAKSLTETGGGNTNLMLILDVSGSMNDPSGLTGLSRLDVMKASVLELLEQYDNPGDVKVQIARFASDAFVDNPVWMTVDAAKAYVNGLTANGGTDYDAAIAAAQLAFATAGKIAGAQNVAYFLSDGVPTEGGGISPSEEAGWTTFLNTNDINSFAFGMGSGTTLSTLNPLAFDGRGAGTDRNAEIITDLEQLDTSLAGSVIQPTSGNILTEGTPPSAFGADAGYVRSITYGTQTFVYDRATNTISVVGSGSATQSFNASTHLLTIITASQGTVAIDLDDGNYTYTPPTQIVSSQVAQFGFALIDGDSDVASSTLSFVLSNFDLPPIVRDDVVRTNIVGNGASIVIPDYALLYNDHDPDGQAIAVTAAGSANSGSVTLAGGNVTFTDE